MINVTSAHLSFFFQFLSSKKALKTVSIFALISAGPEDTGCPSLSPGLQPSLRNLGPLCTIVLSCRKCGPLLTPSIHWVSCVRLPRPVFICFAFCLRPPYRIFSDIPRAACKERGWHYLWGGERPHSVVSTHLHLCGGISTLAVPHPAVWPAVFWQSF